MSHFTTVAASGWWSPPGELSSRSSSAGRGWLSCPGDELDLLPKMKSGRPKNILPLKLFQLTLISSLLTDAQEQKQLNRRSGKEQNSKQFFQFFVG